MYRLSPLRHLGKRFQSAGFDNGEDGFYSHLPHIPSIPDGNIPDIYERQQGPSYAPMPDLYDTQQDLNAQENFNRTPSNFSGEENVFEQEANPDAIEINEAINEVKDLIYESNEAFAQQEMVMNENPNMPFEPEITQEPMMEQSMEQMPEMEQPQEMFQGPEINPMDLEQKLNDPFMNPLFDPLFGPMNPFGPGF